MDDIELVKVALCEIQAAEGPGAQIMIVGEIDGDRQFPIFIGPHEMEALDMALHGKKAARPMTHDLIHNLIDGMKGNLIHVLIDELQDNTFYAKLVVRLENGEEVYIDSRPSDALVIAARRSTPLFVNGTILEEIGRQPDSDNDLE